MKAIKIRIEGTTPLLCNRFTDEAQMSATNGNRPATVGDRGSPQEQAEKKLYRDETGELVIPQPNMFRCIIDGGSFFKNGKSKITTLKTSLIPSCVEIPGVTIPLEHKTEWRVDTRPVRIPSTGGRVLCHRPCFEDWSLSFLIDLDESILSEKLLREILDASGKRVGLGDFRPACKGPFGKFVVTHWQLES